MASIRGIGITDLNQELTERGAAYEGNLWLDGEKVGYFENRGDGGSTTIRFEEPSDRKEFEKRVTEYYSDYPAQLSGEEGFVLELISLSEAEDHLSALKNADTSLWLIETHKHDRMTPLENYEYDDLAPKYFKARRAADIARIIGQHRPKQAYVFRAKEDFNVEQWVNIATA